MAGEIFFWKIATGYEKCNEKRWVNPVEPSGNEISTERKCAVYSVGLQMCVAL